MDAVQTTPAPSGPSRVAQVREFIEAVRAIKALGVSVLIAESHVQNAGRIADRLYAIDRGEIIFSGRPPELLANAEVMRTLHG